MEEGKVKMQGSFLELKMHPDMMRMMDTLKAKSVEESPTKEGQEEQEDLMDFEDDEAELDKALHEPDLIKKISSAEKQKSYNPDENYMADEGTTMTKNEEDEEINVPWSLYLNYFSQGYIWLVVPFITLPFMFLFGWSWMTI